MSLVKRPINGIPDIAKLTDDQNEAFKKILTFLESPQKMYCLTGYAGTGKTTLVSFLIEYILATSTQNISASALTNKATLVLMQKSEIYDDRLQFNTIHSLLKIRPVIDAYGNEKFKPDPRGEQSLTDFSYVFVDEASMLDNNLFVDIYRYLMADDSTTKVIFVGDPFQLNPINHKDALPMIPEQRKKFDIGHTLLKNIVRQAEDNPIIKFSGQLRKMIYKPESLAQKGSNDGIWMIPRDKRKKIIETFFCTEKYDEDPSYCKLIAWRNDTVNKYNRIIRTMKYGKGIPDLIKGEILIVDKPIMDFFDESQILFFTNEELVIEDLVVSDTMAQGQKFKIYEAMAKSLTTDSKQSINLIHEDSRSDFLKKLGELKEFALKATQGTKEARTRWVGYYDFERKFARCKYSFALTAHRSQGTTLKNAIVLPNDILANSKKVEAYRCLYVAATRCSHKLLLF